MKKLILLLVVLCAFKVQAQQAAENEIKKVMLLQQEAWNKSDLNGFMAHYWKSDSLRFISKNGIKYGWQKVYDGYQKNYAGNNDMGQLQFEIMSVDLCSAETAMVVGSWKVNNKKGEVSGYFTLWLKKINGNWLIVVDHTS